MRKIIAVEFVSLDGVIQAPGGPDEDRTSGFKFGGWLVPFMDEKAGEALDHTYGRAYDLLLGRRTYDIFADYWPKYAEKARAEGQTDGNATFAFAFEACRKYVATHSPETLSWKHSVSLGTDIADGVSRLKQEEGKDLIVVGSSELLHTLLEHALVDELHLHIAPVILGKGKKLFDEKSLPRTMKLIRSVVSPTGVLLMNYAPAGEVVTGHVDG